MAAAYGALFILSIVSAIVLYYMMQSNPTDGRRLNVHETLDKTYSSVPERLIPVLFSSAQAATCPIEFTVEPTRKSVQDAMKQSLKDRVFIMQNGLNEGIYISWTQEHAAESGCLAKLALVAAEHFNASKIDLKLPKMLYNTMGETISTAADIENASRRLHVLYDQEVWVWPGIEIGYQWKVDGIEMETLSLDPKVILVKEVVSDEECDSLIQAGNAKMKPSPSISSDNSAFPDYRTSNTAFISEAPVSQKIAKRAQRIARLPYPGYVESLQLVKYQVGQWFKKHTDYFDHFDLASELKSARADGLIDHDFTAWVRYVGKIAAECTDDCAPEIRPGMPLYPSVDSSFQNELLRRFLNDQENPGHSLLNSEWEKWIKDNIENGARNILVTLCKEIPKVFVHIRKIWEDVADSEAFHVVPEEKFIEPNRQCTLFLYLNTVEEGGETVFPRATPKDVPQIVREGMPECSDGFHVKPIKRYGALFYSKTPRGDNDPMSYHGACPPLKGIKYGSNVFMWNVDAKWGVKTWKF